jgi:hypothetical protein
MSKGGCCEIEALQQAHQALRKLRQVTFSQDVAEGMVAEALHTAEAQATRGLGASAVVARMGEAVVGRVDLVVAATNVGRRGTGPGTAPMLECAGSEGTDV